MEISETVREKVQEIDSSATPSTLYRIATLQERFLSFLTDGIVILYLVLGWGFFLSRFLKISPFETAGTPFLLFWSGVLAIFLLYFILLEGILTTTLGKFLGGLIVHKRKGGTPSLFSILIRNIFRLIDFPLFFLTGAGLMEIHRKHRRLGDWLAGTVVLKKMSHEENSSSGNQIGSPATWRSLTFLFDFFLIGIFFYGMLLAIPISAEWPSAVLLNLTPLFLLLYPTLAELFFGTTIGKLIWGYQVSDEKEAERPTFAQLLVRNLFRPLDLLGIGYFLILFSNSKQRLGDLFSGTVILKGKRTIRNWLVIPYMLLLAALPAYLGWIQPNNFLRKEQQIRIGLWSWDPIPMSIRRLWLKSLTLERLELGFGLEDVNERGRFHRGEVIYLLFRLSGFEEKGGVAWIQADLRVRDPKGRVVLEERPIINKRFPIKKREVLPLATRFAIHPQAITGRFEAELVLRDQFRGTVLARKIPFWVR